MKIRLRKKSCWQYFFMKLRSFNVNIHDEKLSIKFSSLRMERKHALHNLLESGNVAMNKLTFSDTAEDSKERMSVKWDIINYY